MYQFKREQLVKADLQTCWEFFSSPKNLKKITPPYMGFDVLSEIPETMYEGLMIGYRVKPLFHIPVEWITEITHVREKKFFVDEQRKGPYKIWHHEHHFEETENGVLMTDIVTYEMPFGILGKMVHPFVVKKKLEEIFDFRRTMTDAFFAE